MTISIDSILRKFSDDWPLGPAVTVEDLPGFCEQQLIDLRQEYGVFYSELTDEHGPFLECLSLSEFQFLCNYFSLI